MSSGGFEARSPRHGGDQGRALHRSRTSLTVGVGAAIGSVLSAIALATSWTTEAGFVIALGVGINAVVALTAVVTARGWSRQNSLSQHANELRELQLATAVNNISQGLCMFDASTRIVICNQRYLHMYNLSPEIVKPGCTLLELIRHRAAVGLLLEDPEAYCRNILDKIGNGETSRTLIESRDGRFFHVVDHPIAGGGWVTTHEDVTERRKAELDAAAARADAERARQDALAAHNRLRDALDVVPEGIALFDADGRYVLWNKRYADPQRSQIRVGMSFEEFLRQQIEIGRVAEAKGREKEWLAERLARHALREHSEEQRISDDSWVRIEERRTADGGSITVRVDITDLKRREASFRLLFDGNPLPMWVFDRISLRFLAVNGAAVDHYGYSREQFLAMTLLDIRPAEDHPLVRQTVGQSSGWAGTHRSWRHRKADGTLIDVSIFSRPLSYNGHTATLVAAVDITQRKQAEEELRSTREFLNTIVDNVPSTITVKDARDLRYMLINRAGEQLFGMPREQVIGKTGRDLLPEQLAKTIEGYDRQVLETRTGLRNTEHPMKTVAHEQRIVDSRRVPILGANGEPELLLIVSEDVTERVAAQQRIEHLAHHDVLTDLPNRTAFIEHIEKIIGQTTGGSSFAVMCLDLDQFKEANDLFGHAVGDALLVEVARRMSAIAGDAFLARVGGDEFIIISSGGEQPGRAEALGDELLGAVSENIHINGHVLRIGLSIGVAVYPTDASDLTTLLANADAALYRAKAEGRGIVRFFDAEMDRRLRERRALQHDLISAISNRQLTLHYQPQARIDGKIIGFEALARWSHPSRGSVSPGIFIPLAEESGLILSMGEWILQEGCREAASWPEPLQIAINLSPVQFRHGDLVALVHSVLLNTGLAPSRLELEITEGVLIDDFSQAISVLRQLKSLGVRIAMDDFGTGYSSLSYLQSFPFDKIKIDQTFISNINNNTQSMAIVRAIISLARGLELPVLAEGVESKDQLTFLANEGCQEVQGYFLGMPRPIADYGELTGAGGRSSNSIAALAG
jgi:diguanylate cyclase (GGDEF)-like protein/PAS domain S-box-containing protein